VEIMPQDLMAGRDTQLEKAVEVAMAQTIKNPIVQPKRPAFPVHPGKQETIADSALPVPGSAFAAPAKQEVKTVSDGKFAAYLGKFDTPMGVVSFTQEGDKLIGDAGGERIELFSDQNIKDNFKAQTASVNITFERDAGGKVVGLTIVIPSGRELKGKRIN
jgi:hypothetical protein